MTTLLRRPFDLVLLLSLRVQWTRSIALVGYEEAMGFLHQMRTLHSTVPVVVASSGLGASERAVSMGAFAFIPQPIQLEELARVVARALAANRHGRGPDDSTVV
jgi:DNA-binding NtrC family response regulator